MVKACKNIHSFVLFTCSQPCISGNADRATARQLLSSANQDDVGVVDLLEVDKYDVLLEVL